MSEHLINIGDQNINIELDEGDVLADVWIVGRALNIGTRTEKILAFGGDTTSTVTGVGVLTLALQTMKDDALGYYEDDE